MLNAPKLSLQEGKMLCVSPKQISSVEHFGSPFAFTFPDISIQKGDTLIRLSTITIGDDVEHWIGFAELLSKFAANSGKPEIKGQKEKTVHSPVEISGKNISIIYINRRSIRCGKPHTRFLITLSQLDITNPNEKKWNIELDYAQVWLREEFESKNYPEFTLCPEFSFQASLRNEFPQPLVYFPGLSLSFKKSDPNFINITFPDTPLRFMAKPDSFNSFVTVNSLLFILFLSLTQNQVFSFATEDLLKQIEKISPPPLTAEQQIEKMKKRLKATKKNQPQMTDSDSAEENEPLECDYDSDDVPRTDPPIYEDSDDDTQDFRTSTSRISESQSETVRHEKSVIGSFIQTPKGIDTIFDPDLMVRTNVNITKLAIMIRFIGGNDFKEHPVGEDFCLKNRALVSLGDSVEIAVKISQIFFSLFDESTEEGWR